MRFIYSYIIDNLFLWVGVEYYLDGQIFNQHSDTVYAIILASLITDKLSNKEYRGDYNK